MVVAEAAGVGSTVTSGAAVSSAAVVATAAMPGGRRSAKPGPERGVAFRETTWEFPHEKVRAWADEQMERVTNRLVEIFHGVGGMSTNRLVGYSGGMAVRDPEATRARIFAAATEEFAAYGIAGARIDRIAQNARANKQLIYAYFGDKAELFAHVLEQKMFE